MAPTHYHLMLCHDGTSLKDIRLVDERVTAREDAPALTRQLQAHLGATTYTVRAEPCTLVHFPEPGLLPHR